MFEYHGWATIRSSSGIEDDDAADAAQEEAVLRVRGLVDALSGRWNCDARLLDANGSVQFSINGFHNHYQSDVRELFAEIARTAPGSYGVLHLHDDEAVRTLHPEAEGRRNDWLVLIMKRGAVEQFVEEHLSPMIGELEDQE